MHFNWISTASLIASNKMNYLQSKIDAFVQHRFIKSFVFQLGRISHYGKKITVISID